MLLVGCREVGSDTLVVSAMGARSEVFEDVGDERNAVNTHNGVNWYLSENRLWGFAPGGDGVDRNSCDTTNPESNDRLCWQTNGVRLMNGYRCGSNRLNGNSEWERVVLERLGDVPDAR